MCASSTPLPRMLWMKATWDKMNRESSQSQSGTISQVFLYVMCSLSLTLNSHHNPEDK